MAQMGENILPKTARTDDAGRAPWPISVGQQIYGRRDVGVSYESDFDAGQCLPLILLRHKRRRFVCLICRMQQGHRERCRAMATISLRRIVAIEFGM